MTGISADLKSLLPPTYFDKSGNLTVSDADATKVATGIQAKIATMPPAEATIFLASLGAASLAPLGSNIPDNIDALLSNFASAVDAIVNFVSVGDLESFMGKVMIKQAHEEEKNALDTRLASRQEAKADLLSQASKMHEEATKMRTGAIISLVVAVVSAAVTLGFAGASMSKSNSAMGEIKGMSGSSEAGPMEEAPTGIKDDNELVALDEPGPEQVKVDMDKQVSLAKINILNSQGQALGSVGGAFNALGGALAGAVNSFAQADAKDIEAEGAVDAANAQETQAIGDHLKEIQGALQNLIDKVIQFLKDLQDTKAQAMQSMTKV